MRLSRRFHPARPPEPPRHLRNASIIRFSGDYGVIFTISRLGISTSTSDSPAHHRITTTPCTAHSVCSGCLVISESKICILQVKRESAIEKCSRANQPLSVPSPLRRLCYNFTFTCVFCEKQAKRRVNEHDLCVIFRATLQNCYSMHQGWKLIDPGCLPYFCNTRQRISNILLKICTKHFICMHPCPYSVRGY